jgi:ACS family tartrate transporter-like MFS transporter
MSVSVNRDLALEVTTMRRVSWRLVPFLLLAHLTAYIDRVNVGFAALQMNKTVGIDPKTYGLGAVSSLSAILFWKCQAIWHSSGLARAPGSRAL